MRLGRWLRRRKLGDPQQLGRLGEWLAHDYLAACGYDIVARNWRAPFGEVDIVAQKDGRLHFVEVKSRLRDPEHRPEEAVTAERRARYLQLARYFQKEHHAEDRSALFHVIGIEFEPTGDYELTFIEDALK